MRNFMHGLYKLFGPSHSLIYAIYLKLTKKLPYEIEMSLKPEAKDRYIQIEFVCLLLYFALLTSLMMILTLTHFNSTLVITCHIGLMVVVFIVQIILKKELYI